MLEPVRPRRPKQEFVEIAVGGSEDEIRYPFLGVGSEEFDNVRMPYAAEKEE